MTIAEAGCWTVDVQYLVTVLMVLRHFLVVGIGNSNKRKTSDEYYDRLTRNASSCDYMGAAVVVFSEYLRTG